MIASGAFYTINESKFNTIVCICKTGAMFLHLIDDN